MMHQRMCNNVPCLGSFTIESFLRTLCTEANKRTDHKKYLFLNQMLANSLYNYYLAYFDERMQDREKKMRNIGRTIRRCLQLQSKYMDPKKEQYIFVPLWTPHKNINHWLMATICTREQWIEIYDPLNSQEYTKPWVIVFEALVQTDLFIEFTQTQNLFSIRT